MKYVLYITALALGLQMTACSEKKQTLGERGPDVKATFEKVCSACHSIDIPLSRNKSPEGWRETVNRMKSKGLSIDQKTTDDIVNYLISTRGVK